MPKKNWELYLTVSGRLFLGTFEGNEKDAIKEASRLSEQSGLDRIPLSDTVYHDVEVEEE